MAIFDLRFFRLLRFSSCETVPSATFSHASLLWRAVLHQTNRFTNETNDQLVVETAIPNTHSRHPTEIHQKNFFKKQVSSSSSSSRLILHQLYHPSSIQIRILIQLRVGHSSSSSRMAATPSRPCLESCGNRCGSPLWISRYGICLSV